jgi:hypothetical protein
MKQATILKIRHALGAASIATVVCAVAIDFRWAWIGVVSCGVLACGLMTWLLKLLMNIRPWFRRWWSESSTDEWFLGFVFQMMSIGSFMFCRSLSRFFVRIYHLSPIVGFLVFFCSCTGTLWASMRAKSFRKLYRPPAA